jgi:hypothetical protein
VNDTIIETPVMELQAQAPRTTGLAVIEGGRQVSVLERSIEFALKNNANLDQLQQLLAMKERLDETDARKAFVEAMAIFKRNPPEILKDKLVDFPSKGGRTTYYHATLASVVSAAIQGLAAVGISHRWEVAQKDGTIAVTCILTHCMGHSEETRMEAGADNSGGKNSIQAVASSITYLQRYTLLSATGLATKDQDDDGAQHKEPLEDWVDDHLENVRSAKTAEELQVFWQAAASICRRKGEAGVAGYREIKADVERLLREFHAAAEASK